MSFDAATFLAGLTVEAPRAAPSPAPLVVVCEADETPIPYKPPEEWDAADRAVVEGYHGNGRIFTVTGAAPAGSVPGVPLAGPPTAGGGGCWGWPIPASRRPRSGRQSFDCGRTPWGGYDRIEGM